MLPAPGAPLRVLFCGINPSLYSAATGWHFARPGNRFWPALHLSGFTPRRLAPAEQQLLPGYGLGITNLVARATAQASELDAAELRAGGERLAALVGEYRPRILAVAGVTAYRTAFGRPRATIGRQPPLSATSSVGPQPPPPAVPRPSSPAGLQLPSAGLQVWVLPNPSGLNALWTTSKLIEAFRDLRLHVEGLSEV